MAIFSPFLQVYCNKAAALGHCEDLESASLCELAGYCRLLSDEGIIF